MKARLHDHRDIHRDHEHRGKSVFIDHVDHELGRNDLMRRQGQHEQTVDVPAEIIDAGDGEDREQEDDERGARVQHDADRGHGGSGKHDGPHAVAPSPRRVEEDVLAEVRPGVERGNGRDGFGESEEDAAVDEAGDVGDEDLLRDVPPGVAERVEDASSLAGR